MTVGLSTDFINTLNGKTPTPAKDVAIDTRKFSGYNLQEYKAAVEEGLKGSDKEFYERLQKRGIESSFQAFDTDGDGVLSKDEAIGVSSTGLSQKKFAEALNGGSGAFLARLMERKQGEIEVTKEPNEEFSEPLVINQHKTFYIRPQDKEKAQQQINAGFTDIQETPDSSVVFMTPTEVKQMKEDRANCVGCLSQCQFSTWSRANGTTGRLADPRSYCIHKTLYDIGHNGNVDDNLLFAGHQVYRFAADPLYKNGHVPTVKELIEKIKIGQ